MAVSDADFKIMERRFHDHEIGCEKRESRFNSRITAVEVEIRRNTKLLYVVTTILVGVAAAMIRAYLIA